MSGKPFTIQLVPDTSAKLGESPLWSPEEERLYWIDCNTPELVRMNPASGTKERWAMPQRIGGLVLGQDGPIVILADGVYSFDTGSERLHMMAPRPFDSDHLLLHEARCDRQGRLWVGLINHHFIDHGALGECQLFRLEGSELVPQALAGGGTVSNGLAWSPAGDVMYYADTVGRTIWAFDYDTRAGEISRKRLFHQISDEQGLPDGAAVDCDGGYWIALSGSGELARFLPDGTWDRTIDLPVDFVTMPAFAGPELDLMYVTSASFVLTAEQLAAAPDNGTLMRFRPGFKGIAESRFVFGI